MRTSQVLLSSLGKVSLLVASCVAMATPGCAPDAAPSDDHDDAVTEGEQALARIASAQDRFQIPVFDAEPHATKAGRKLRPAIGPAAIDGFEPGSVLKPLLSGAAAARAAQVSLPSTANGQTTLEDASSHVRVSFSLRGASATPASVAGGYALYQGAYQGADVIHRVHAEGTEDFVLFETQPAREALAYDLDVSQVAGLRLVSDTLEMLDAAGTPTLRVAAPYVVDANGVVHQAKLTVDGCAVDTNPAAPWGRAVTAPGASTCTVQVGWQNVAYPALVDPSWTTTGSLSFHRWGMAATRLSSGKVLYTGGNLYASLSAELYDPATGVFSTTAPMTLTRAWHSAHLLPSGKVLVAGGAFQQDASGWDYDYTPTTELYDPATGLFTAGPTMPDAPVVASSLASGDVVILGGMTGASGVYRAASNTITATGTPVVAQYSSAAALLPSGKVLFAGGTDTYWGGLVASAQLFDPAANGGVGAFTATGSLLSPRIGHRATTLASGKVLVTGGYGGGTANEPKSTQVYDPATGAFTAGPSLAWDRSFHQATLLDSGRVLVTGANWNDGSLSWHAHTEEFDVTAGTVVQSDAPAVFAETHTATKLASGVVLLALGSNGGGGSYGTRAALYDASGTAPPPPPPPTCNAPAAPTSLYTTNQYRAIKTTWSASANPTGGFRVYRRTSTGAYALRASVAKTARTWTDTGLAYHATYVYQVKGWSDCNGNGVFDTGDKESAGSNEASGRAN